MPALRDELVKWEKRNVREKKREKERKKVCIIVYKFHAKTVEWSSCSQNVFQSLSTNFNMLPLIDIENVETHSDMGNIPQNRWIYIQEFFK